MSSNEHAIQAGLERFYVTFNSYFDTIIYYFQEARARGLPVVPAEGLTLVRNFFPKEKEKLLEMMIEKAHPFLDQLFNKDEQFFVEQARAIIPGIPESQITLFTNLFTCQIDGKPFLTDDDKDALWTYFHTIAKVAIKHMHLRREPASKKNADGSIVHGYKVKYFAQVDLTRLSKMWGVELKFPDVE